MEVTRPLSTRSPTPTLTVRPLRRRTRAFGDEGFPNTPIKLTARMEIALACVAARATELPVGRVRVVVGACGRGATAATEAVFVACAVVRWAMAATR